MKNNNNNTTSLSNNSMNPENDDNYISGNQRVINNTREGISDNRESSLIMQRNQRTSSISEAVITKPVIDIVFRKVFDMKMKPGHEFNKAFIGENAYLKSFYFLKSNKVYVVDISSKKLEEQDYIKNKDIVYLGGSQRNLQLVLVNSSGVIYIVNQKENRIYFIKNFLLHSVKFGANNNTKNNKVKPSSTQSNKDNTIDYNSSINHTNNCNELKIYVAESNEKVLVINDDFFSIWYSINDLKAKITNNNSNNQNNNDQSNNNKTLRSEKSRGSLGSSHRSSSVNETCSVKPEQIELNGTFYTISLENERNNIFIKNNNLFFDTISSVFGNNTYLGSHIKVSYVVLSLVEQTTGIIEEEIITSIHNNNNCSTKSKQGGIAYLKNKAGSLFRMNSNSSFKGDKSKKDSKDLNDNQNTIDPYDQIVNPNVWKLSIVDFLFQFDKNKLEKTSLLKSNSHHKISNETLHNISKKVFFTSFDFSVKKQIINDFYNSNNSNKSNLKKRLISKYNKTGSHLVIVANSENNFHSRIFLYSQETCKLKSFRIQDIFKTEMDTNIDDEIKNIWIEDVSFICNDFLILLLFSSGYFCIFDFNFNLLSFTDTSKSIVSSNFDNPTYLSCPSYFFTNKEFLFCSSNLGKYGNLSIIPSILYEDYFIIYFGLYSICYQINLQNHKTKLANMKKLNTLPDLLNYFTYYQNSNLIKSLYSKFTSLVDTISSLTLEYNSPNCNVTQNNMINNQSHLLNSSISRRKSCNFELVSLKEGEFLERIHNYLVVLFQEVDEPENEKEEKKENDEESEVPFDPKKNKTAVKKAINVFSLFIQILRNLYEYHEINLSLISYMFGITNDFFYHLLNIRELGLAYVFLNISEKYLLKPMSVKQNKYGSHAYITKEAKDYNKLISINNMSSNNNMNNNSISNNRLETLSLKLARDSSEKLSNNYNKPIDTSSLITTINGVYEKMKSNNYSINEDNHSLLTKKPTNNYNSGNISINNNNNNNNSNISLGSKQNINSLFPYNLTLLTKQNFLDKYYFSNLQVSYNIFNPHPITNSAINIQNKYLNNRTLQCKLRLLFIFNCLIEFRTETPENIINSSDEDSLSDSKVEDNDSESVKSESNSKNHNQSVNPTFNSSKYSNSRAQNNLLQFQNRFLNNYQNQSNTFKKAKKETKEFKMKKKIADKEKSAKKNNIKFLLMALNCIEDLKRNNSLDDIQVIIKALVRNYKYLKNENTKAGSEEFVLNGMTLNPRTELMSYLIHSRVAREDIDFSFFSSFFPLEELHSFNDVTVDFCLGKEQNVFEALSYCNHTGKIQKWLLFMNNKLYEELFDDIRSYYYNHYKQLKEKHNFEVDSLVSFVSFNFLFFSFNLLLMLKQYLIFELLVYSCRNDSYVGYSGGRLNSNNSNNGNTGSGVSYNNRLLFLASSFLYNSSSNSNNNTSNNNSNINNKENVISNKKGSDKRIFTNKLFDEDIKQEVNYNNILFSNSKYDCNSTLTEVISNPSHLKTSLLSSVDAPFLIFEYFILTDNSKNKTLLPSEYNMILLNKIETMSKSSSLSYYDLGDFIEFLYQRLINDNISNNSNNNEYNSNSNNNSFTKDKITSEFETISTKLLLKSESNNNLLNFRIKILTTYFVFLYLIIKLNQVHLLEQYFSIFISILEEVDLDLKRIFSEYYYLLLNGLLRYYLNLEINNKLNESLSKNLEIVLCQIKSLFYKIIREDPYQVKINIPQFVFISPSIMKPYLAEGALFYEYKTLNNLLKTNVFSLDSDKINSQIEITEFMCNGTTKNTKNLSINILKFIYYSNNFNNNNNFLLKNLSFHSLNESQSKTTNSYNSYQNKMNKENKEELNQFNKLNNFKSTLKNILEIININNLNHQPYNQQKASSSLNNQNIFFTLESSIDYIRKLIYNTILEKQNKSDTDFQEKLTSIIEKIIKGNFEAKNLFKFSNTEIKSKLIHSIKTNLAKFCHLLICLKLKLLINTENNIIKKLSYISLLAIMDDKTSALLSIIKILDFIKVQNASFFSNNDVFNILKNINFVMLVVNRTLCFPTDFEKFLIKENIAFYNKYNDYIKNDFVIIKSLYSKLKEDIKHKNMRNFILLMFNDMYVELLDDVYGDICEFLSNKDFMDLTYNVNTEEIVVCDCKYKDSINNNNNNQSNTGSKNNSNKNLTYCFYNNSKNYEFATNHNPHLNSPNLVKARKLFISINKNFEKLTGVDSEYFSDFDKNWSLKENKLLYCLIINDETDKINIYANNDTISNNKKYNLIMNKRQLSGADTPKRQRRMANTSNIKNVNSNIDSYTNNTKNEEKDNNASINTSKNNFFSNDFFIVNKNSSSNLVSVNNNSTFKSRNSNKHGSIGMNSSRLFSSNDIIDTNPNTNNNDKSMNNTKMIKPKVANNNSNINNNNINKTLKVPKYSRNKISTINNSTSKEGNKSKQKENTNNKPNLMLSCISNSSLSNPSNKNNESESPSKSFTSNNSNEEEFNLKNFSFTVIQQINKHLKKRFINAFKSLCFEIYKQNKLDKDLEEIRVFNVTTKNTLINNFTSTNPETINKYCTNSNEIADIEEITLKEKYASNIQISCNPEDYVIFNKEKNATEENSKINNKETKIDKILPENLSPIKETVYNNNNNDIKNSNTNTLKANQNIKKFDIINLNKYKSGSANRSTILKELKSTNGKNIQNVIKKKLEEIQFKLNKYENLAKNIGKDLDEE